MLNDRDKIDVISLMNCASEFNSGTGGSGGFSGNSEDTSKPEFNSGTGGAGGFSGSKDQSSKPEFNSGTGGSGGFSGSEDQNSKPGAIHQKNFTPTCFSRKLAPGKIAIHKMSADPAGVLRGSTTLPIRVD
jgi:hypothetical protein